MSNDQFFDLYKSFILLQFRLYKSLGDYDVIEGIFCGRGSNEATSAGLKLEASGSFKEARRVYEQVALHRELKIKYYHTFAQL